MEAALPPAPPPRPSAADKLGSSAEKGRERGEERPLRRVQLIVGVDEVDRLKGIPLKLHAYRQLLREHPPLRGKVVLAQVGLMQAYTPVGGHSLSTQAALDELRALTKEGRSRAGRNHKS
ncbi:hypothetical protein T492DRAFT_834535 [Pavlovales sp. CCMP2436]|nr:hypothetical protein T492DRAFT_834535 [Pavlovales sp. CCMP2436]